MSHHEDEELATRLQETSLDDNVAETASSAGVSSGDVPSTSAPAEVTNTSSGYSTGNTGAQTSTTPAQAAPDSPGSRTSSSCSSDAGRQRVIPIAKRDLDHNSQTFAPRPAKSIQDSALGQKIVCETNYFKLALESNDVYQYSIEYFNEKKQPMTKRDETKHLFWGVCRQHSHMFPRHTQIIFNDVNVLLMKERLRTDRGEHWFVLKKEMGKRVKTFHVNIKFTGMVSLKSLPQNDKERMNLVSAIDALVTMRIRCPLIKDSEFFVSNGRSMFYAPTENRQTHFRDTPIVIPLGKGLEAWTGLNGALKECQDGLLYNVDIGHSVFQRQRMNLVEFYVEVLNDVPFEQLLARDPEYLRNVGIDNGSLKKLFKALTGLTLTAVYGHVCKNFKFSMFQKSAREMRFNLEGRNLSVEEYFYNQYNLRLQMPHLPVFKVGKGYIPMELIFTSADPVKYKGRLPEKQLRTMIQNCGYAPEVRKRMIMSLCSSTEHHPTYLHEQDDFMKEFGVKVDKNFIDVPATILPVPSLQYGNRKIVDKEHHGAWELGNDSDGLLQIKKPKTTKLVAGVIFLENDRNRSDRDLRPFGFLMETLHHFGVEVPGGKESFYTQSFDPNRVNWGDMYSEMMKFKAEVEKFDRDAQPMILFVMPYKSTTSLQRGGAEYNEYAMMKYICDVRVGIYCQCILANTYIRMRGRVNTCATSQNVAVKILGKLGVEHYTLEREGFHKNWTRLTSPDKPTLLLGIDVTHPGAVDRKAGGHHELSVACVVGNVDTDCMRFGASSRVQKFCEERTVSLKDEVTERIVAFEKNTGLKPAHIVVYRDGISESMFQGILHAEKAAIEEACRGLHPEYRPTLTYMVVSKRHHTRLFAKNRNDTSGDYGNMKPGTLVEKTITTKSYYDFFLNSHLGALGTSRPTHYYVLWDEWNPSNAFWPTITYALSYAYVRCPRAISQPSPVMYAHLAAKRAKDYLNAYSESHGQELARMNDYERSIAMKKSMTAAINLKGMLFV